MERLTSFNQLKDGDRIISPIDNEVTEFMVDEDGDFLSGWENLSIPRFSVRPSRFLYLLRREKCR